MAFSLNPQWIIDRYEHGAASLNQRLDAAAKTAEQKKCSLAFHFDPLLPLKNWQEEYAKVFALMQQKLKGHKINWISLGTFRFPKGFVEQVEAYHPGSYILNEEFYPSSDGKLRYFRPFREEIYKYAMQHLQKLFPETAIYICMETPELWERLLDVPFLSKDLKKQLDQKI